MALQGLGGILLAPETQLEAAPLETEPTPAPNLDATVPVGPTLESPDAPLGTRPGGVRVTRGGTSIATVAVRALRERRRVWIGGILLFFFLGAVGFWVHRGIRNSLRDGLAEELQTILKADLAALTHWLESWRSEVRILADRSFLRSAASSLLSLSRQEGVTPGELAGSTAHEEFVAAVRGLAEEEFVRGVGLVDEGGRVFGATTEGAAGSVRLGAGGLEVIDRVFAGKSVIRPPYAQGSLAQKPVSGAEDDDTPLLLLSAPVRAPGDDRVIAALFVRLLADSEFTRLLQLAWMGDTGETYAFNEQGLMLSNSRFLDQLRELELVGPEPGASSILTVQVRDPGGDLTRGHQPELPLSARPLTRMAAFAIHEGDGHDLDGYRDYRGVTVVGAWSWLPEYGFGVASEVDHDEAYASLGYLNTAFGILFGLLVVAAGAVLYSSYSIIRLRKSVGEARRMGQYTLETKIGEGGMGEVYKARHALLRRPTALKLLRGDRVGKDQLARFEREVQNTSRLTHPNTISVYDYGHTPEGVFYYVMEYVDGLSLEDLVTEEGALPIPRAVHILQQVCRSLREAHAIGLVHRDIKPHNIMISERGEEPDFVTVLDFGLVKDTGDNDGTQITVQQQLTGTPLYMAPERIRDPLHSDVRVDIYSLGAMAYFLLTGKSAFPGATVMEVCSQVLNVDPTPIREHRPEIPSPLEEVVLGCMAKDAEARPESVEFLLRRLDELTREFPWDESAARAWWQRRRQQKAAASEAPPV